MTSASLAILIWSLHQSTAAFLLCHAGFWNDSFSSLHLLPVKNHHPLFLFSPAVFGMVHLHTATTSSEGDLAAHSDAHRLRRTFIGPLPKQSVAQPKGKGKARENAATTDLEDSDGLRDAIRTLALDFFLRHGGVPEQWGEERAQSVRDEMYRRWHQSEWGRSLRQRKDARADRNWVGTSFDVGVFLGVDTLDKASHIGASSSTFAAPGTSLRHVAASTGAETFVTAPSRFSAAHDPQNRTSTIALTTSESNRHGSTSMRPTFSNEDYAEASAADSSTALIPSATAGPSRPTDARPVVSPSVQDIPLGNTYLQDGAVVNGAMHPGKDKLRVHYAEAEPAPPSEVLTRTGEAVENTSAGAAQQADPAAQVAWRSVIMRGMAFMSWRMTPD